MARSMMQFKGLSSSYWVEAVHTTVYLRNISPTTSLDGVTPYESWYGYTPKVKHLRVFGSICYALVPTEKRTKLDSRSIKWIFIDYSDQKKGYHFIFDGKFIVSRDVIFDETKSANSDEINHPLSRLENKKN